MEHAKDEMEYLDKYTEEGLINKLKKAMTEKYKRIPYKECIKILKNIDDIYCLDNHKDEIKIMEGYGEKSVQKLIQSIEKITNSSKSDLKYLKKYGIGLKNYFDIEIARYVLYAGLPKLEPASVEEFAEARKELQEKMEAEEVKDHKPYVVFVDEDNKIAKTSRYEKYGELSPIL